MRVGKVGIVATLQDGGAQRVGHADDLERYKSIDLHPLQFRELSVMYLYKAALMNRTPKFMMTEEETKVTVVQLPIAGLSSKPVFDEWSKEEYAQKLAAYMGRSLDDVFVPPDSVMTRLHDTQGIQVHYEPERAQGQVRQPLLWTDWFPR